MKRIFLALSILGFSALGADSGIKDYCRITSVNAANNVFGDSVAVWGTAGVDDDMTDLGLAPGYFEIGEIAFHAHDGDRILIHGNAASWSAIVSPKSGEYGLTLHKNKDGKGAVQINGKPLATFDCT